MTSGRDRGGRVALSPSRAGMASPRHQTVDCWSSLPPPPPMLVVPAQRSRSTSSRTALHGDGGSPRTWYRPLEGHPDWGAAYSAACRLGSALAGDDRRSLPTGAWTDFAQLPQQPASAPHRTDVADLLAHLEAERDGPRHTGCVRGPSTSSHGAGGVESRRDAARRGQGSAAARTSRPASVAVETSARVCGARPGRSTSLDRGTTYPPPREQSLDQAWADAAGWDAGCEIRMLCEQPSRGVIGDTQATINFIAEKYSF